MYLTLYLDCILFLVPCRLRTMIIYILHMNLHLNTFHTMKLEAVGISACHSTNFSLVQMLTSSFLPPASCHLQCAWRKTRHTSSRIDNTLATSTYLIHLDSIGTSFFILKLSHSLLNYSLVWRF